MASSRGANLGTSSSIFLRRAKLVALHSEASYHSCLSLHEGCVFTVPGFSNLLIMYFVRI